jgi:hypothetical protein
MHAHMHQSKQDIINLTLAVELNTYQKSLDGKIMRVEGERKREEGRMEKKEYVKYLIRMGNRHQTMLV